MRWLWRWWRWWVGDALHLRDGCAAREAAAPVEAEPTVLVRRATQHKQVGVATAGQACRIGTPSAANIDRNGPEIDEHLHAGDPRIRRDLSREATRVEARHRVVEHTAKRIGRLRVRVRVDHWRRWRLWRRPHRGTRGLTDGATPAFAFRAVRRHGAVAEARLIWEVVIKTRRAGCLTLGSSGGDRHRAWRAASLGAGWCYCEQHVGAAAGANAFVRRVFRCASLPARTFSTA